MTRRRFPMPADLMSRWWLRVRLPEDPDGCWEWIGAKWKRGYGKFTLPVSQKRVPAHRWGYEQLVGPVAPNLDMDHLCRNPSCVNPKHLEPVTHVENMRRGVAGLKSSAREAGKIRCIHGHPFDELNTYWRADGGRNCRACGRAVAARRREKRRGLAA
jgi:hypothetical protein